MQSTEDCDDRDVNKWGGQNAKRSAYIEALQADRAGLPFFS
jgi:hypothetical protein